MRNTDVCVRRSVIFYLNLILGEGVMFRLSLSLSRGVWFINVCRRSDISHVVFRSDVTRQSDVSHRQSVFGEACQQSGIWRSAAIEPF